VTVGACGDASPGGMKIRAPGSAGDLVAGSFGRRVGQTLRHFRESRRMRRCLTQWDETGAGRQQRHRLRRMERDVTRAYRESDRRQDRRRYQVSQESQTRVMWLASLAIPAAKTPTPPAIIERAGSCGDASPGGMKMPGMRVGNSRRGKLEPGTKIRQKAANFEPGTVCGRTRGLGFARERGNTVRAAQTLGLGTVLPVYSCS